MGGGGGAQSPQYGGSITSPVTAGSRNLKTGFRRPWGGERIFRGFWGGERIFRGFWGKGGIFRGFWGEERIFRGF